MSQVVDDLCHYFAKVGLWTSSASPKPFFRRLDINSVKAADAQSRERVSQTTNRVAGPSVGEALLRGPPAKRDKFRCGAFRHGVLSNSATPPENRLQKLEADFGVGKIRSRTIRCERSSMLT
jgi:hypothetical protein